tara:strand:+ start:6419 stop:7369 length:951 start_codon:yes stop_codon:yes gene_type:complete
MFKRKALIVGIKGKSLTKDEKKLLQKDSPWGVILFSRNISNIKQLKILISSIKKLMKDKNYPILIDQEGGRVSRLNKLVDFNLFSQSYFGKLYKNNYKYFNVLYKIYIDHVSTILREVGININTVPVLDIYRKESHNVIGDRSFSDNPSIVSKIGNLCIELYRKNKIATVVKHMPGHGLSKQDSHYKLPIVKNKKNYLIKMDFKPFKNCKSPFAMTAHIKYTAYDANFSASHSKIVIKKVIRNHIGFKGLLISDDISMKALKYGLRDNAIKALNAGCNLVLHCNGNIKEMRKLVKIVPIIDKFTQKKTSHFYNFLG